VTSFPGQNINRKEVEQKSSIFIMESVDIAITYVFRFFYTWSYLFEQLLVDNDLKTD